ncbi:hypothetical protein TWF730_009535 [Orbilia blumenaviensis]|uniref:Uncharacterized protein n=1 Tax=Orbilia blumenaviensis TaxID=1796055 RepID=A0AAV9UVB1_9PEZI
MEAARKRKFQETRSTNHGKAPPEKRRKRQDAREISFQTSENAFRDGQFDPVSFVNSREYEIKSLLRSMNNSKNAQRKRAFQSLPRELRRRTAAHNPSRVPKRVRETARKEFAEDNTTIPKKRRDYRPNARRLNANQLRMLSTRTNKPETAFKPQLAYTRKSIGTRSHMMPKSSRYRKRQRHKTWLPTHIWCAKRARMVCKWGFSLAETPNLKSYRPTYRAATRDGCIAVDTSYYATILLEGREGDLKRSLLKFLPPRDLAVVGRSVVSGELARSTWMFEEGQWPNGALAPIHIFWCPNEPLDAAKEQHQNLRKVVLRVHPSSWEEVWSVAKACTAASNCTCKSLRFEVGSIGLVGPRTADILRILLSSSLDFESMAIDKVTNGSGIDPRLSSFYLRGQIPGSHLLENLATNPTANLFNTKYRNASVRAQVSQKTLNSRVSRLVSGNATGSVSDNSIPFVLVREIAGTRADSDSPGSKYPSFHRWSILLPWKWVRPFWLVLMRINGVRLGGLKELEQLTLEGGLGHFPTDFPSTNAGRAEALARDQTRLDLVKRRSTMKTKTSSKRNKSAASAGTEIGSCYPWKEVFKENSNLHKALTTWQLTPDLVRLFWKSPWSTLPPSISSGIFAAHIRIYGRGSIYSNALVYNFSGPEAKPILHTLLQHTRDGKPVDNILEKLKIGETLAVGTGDTAFCLAGFVIRGNFGFCEAAPVAIAALAWSKVYQGEASSDRDSFGGWCILQNKDRGTRRLAQWTAI